MSDESQRNVITHAGVVVPNIEPEGRTVEADPNLSTEFLCKGLEAAIIILNTESKIFAVHAMAVAAASQEVVRNTAPLAELQAAGIKVAVKTLERKLSELNTRRNDPLREVLHNG